MKKASFLLIIILLVFSQLSLGNLSVYATNHSENNMMQNENEATNNEDEIAYSNDEEENGNTTLDDNNESVTSNDEGTNEVSDEEEFTTKSMFGGVIITGYKGNSKEISIPEKINGELVVRIGDYAFANNELTNVEIPGSVIEIGNGAFAGNKLTNIDIPSSVTEIGNHAFANNELTNVDIPSSVTEIGNHAFAYNELTNINIPSSVTEIGYAAFIKNKLTSIKIPSSMTEVREYAFAYNELTNIDIPSSVTAIGYGAFAENKLTSIKIPSSVTEIRDYAFANNELTNVDIPSSVTAIVEGAFYNNSLDFVTFNGTHNFQWTEKNSPFNPQKKEGRTFLGWFEDEGFTIDWKYSVVQPMTIYAKWSHYAVTFDSDGGSEVPTMMVAYNETMKAPSNPVKEGYAFEGWYKDKELKELWDFDQDVVKSDITLYAKWKKINYTVAFDSNGGSKVPSQSVGAGELVKAPSTPVKEGYTFTGWYKDKGLIEAWSFNQDVVTQDITLYAKWSKVSYTITFDVNGGSEVPSRFVGHGELVKVPAGPKKEGYTFDGWYKDAEFKNVWDFAKDRVTADITLYAKWTKDHMSESSYIVRFDFNGGSKVPSQTVTYKALVKAPSKPKKEGHIFIGWYKNKNFTKAWDFAKDVVTEDLTLYARWMQESTGCDITFKDIDDNWAKDMIQEVASRCIIKGYPDGAFRPNNLAQRQHVVLMVDRALQPTPIREAVSFSDVPKNHVYYEQITRLQRASIVDGSNGEFRPNAYITRAQMAKIMVLAFGLTPEGNSTFKDVDPSHWASGYIAALADHNIALGDENGNFRPNENLTRAQFTAFMYRALGL